MADPLVEESSKEAPMVEEIYPKETNLCEREEVSNMSAPVDNVSSAKYPSGLCTTTGSSIPPPPDTVSMKQNRKQSTLVIGLAGVCVGLLFGGPIVGLVAGFTSAAVTKRTMKKREKKALRKYQKELAETLSPTCYY